MPLENHFENFSKKLEQLTALVPKIPRSVPIGKKSDHIYQLREALEPFSSATLQLSHENQATLPFSLPLYLKLKLHLHAIICDRNNVLKIRHAAGAGLEKLLKYRAYVDENHYYKVATALHPSMRVEWFRKLCETPVENQKQVDDVRLLLETIGKSYAERHAAALPSINAGATSKTTSESAAAVSTESFLSDICDVVIPVKAADNTGDTPSADKMLKDELDRYVKFEGGKGALEDPLGWWKIHAPAFPILASMARDFLAIPATSVSVERLFSKSRHICQDLRGSLKAQTVTQALLTKVWISSGLFDIEEPPKKKRKHGEIS